MLEAVKSGDTAQVKKLLDMDAALANARAESGESAILLSVYYGQAAIRDLLLACGAQLTIFEAAAAGQVERLEILEQATPGALRRYSHDGFTPLHLGAFFGHPEAVKFLLARGADVNATSKNASALRPIHSAVAHRGDAALAIAKMLIAAGAEINVAQQGGWTPLHAAAFHGHTEMVKLLLAHGADAAALADNGKTALAMASEKGHKNAAGALRKHGTA
jgi:ankyrin repeat protein